MKIIIFTATRKFNITSPYPLILGYNAYREICQVGKARRWEDLEDYIDKDNVSKLKQVYNHVDDVDLFVGGFLEGRHGDSPLKVGPTFKCIIGDTFAR